MIIPAVWPTPNNPATRVRVFRTEIERPANQVPVITFHLSEAIEAGSSSFETYKPEFALTASLSELLADAELGQLAGTAATALEQIAYVLYLRKKAAIENPPVVPVV